MPDTYHPGDHWIVDDKTGFKIRASEARKQWDGALTHRDHFEPRHPQDLIRSKPERSRVDDPRPRPIDTYIGPLTTLLASAHAAGATSINVESSVRMDADDAITIMLDNGMPHRTTIASITDAANIIINQALTWSAAAGNFVVDNTAMSPSDVA